MSVLIADTNSSHPALARLPHVEDPSRYAFPQIRFGIMCKGTTFEDWQARCIEHLLRIGNASAVLLIVDDAVASSSGFQTLKRIAKKTSSRRLMFEVYDRFLLRSHAARSVNIAQLLSEAAILRCRTVRVGRYSEYFTEADVETIRKFNLDFIIRFAFGVIREKYCARPGMAYGRSDMTMKRSTEALHLGSGRSTMVIM